MTHDAHHCHTGSVESGLEVRVCLISQQVARKIVDAQAAAAAAAALRQSFHLWLQVDMDVRRAAAAVALHNVAAALCNVAAAAAVLSKAAAAAADAIQRSFRL